jgi:hypothetical protein
LLGFEASIVCIGNIVSQTLIKLRYFSSFPTLFSATWRRSSWRRT